MASYTLWSIGWRDGSLRRAARVEEPVSGRVLELFTTEPGVPIGA